MYIWKRDGKNHSLNTYLMLGHHFRCSDTYVLRCSWSACTIGNLVPTLQMRKQFRLRGVVSFSQCHHLSASGRTGGWAWAFWFYVVTADIYSGTSAFLFSCKDYNMREENKKWLEVKKKWMQNWAKKIKRTSSVLSWHFLKTLLMNRIFGERTSWK